MTTSITVNSEYGMEPPQMNAASFYGLGRATVGRKRERTCTVSVTVSSNLEAVSIL